MTDYTFDKSYVHFMHFILFSSVENLHLSSKTTTSLLGLVFFPSVLARLIGVLHL